MQHKLTTFLILIYAQDVAFGTKNLKLDCGKHIIILAVIRTLIPSRVIEQ